MPCTEGVFSSRPLKVFYFILALIHLPLTVPAPTLVWTNNSSGNWANAANWSPNQVPGPTDDATLNVGVTVTNSAPVAISNFTLAAGSLNATSPVTVLGAMNWTGGNISSGSTLNIASSAVLYMTNSATHNLAGLILNNAGTVAWGGGQIQGGTGTTINNTV